MRLPISTRNKIPFYCEKSNVEFRNDIYERYDPMVIRQSMIHLTDTLWEDYPMKSILRYVKNEVDNTTLNILEVGCGVGKCIAEIADSFSSSYCWGIDYSYQMLKKANETWVENRGTVIDISRFGFEDPIKLKSKSLKNLKFGLAKCEDLPFDDDSQDIVFSSFLFDRLIDPKLGLKEMKRVVKSKGIIIIVTPLNFDNRINWTNYFPAAKLKCFLLDAGFDILDWQEDIIVKEPMDLTGNVINWKCLKIILQ